MPSSSSPQGHPQSALDGMENEEGSSTKDRDKNIETSNADTIRGQQQTTLSYPQPPLGSPPPSSVQSEFALAQTRSYSPTDTRSQLVNGGVGMGLGVTSSGFSVTSRMDPYDLSAEEDALGYERKGAETGSSTTGKNKGPSSVASGPTTSANNPKTDRAAKRNSADKPKPSRQRTRPSSKPNGAAIVSSPSDSTDPEAAMVVENGKYKMANELSPYWNVRRRAITAVVVVAVLVGIIVGAVFGSRAARRKDPEPVDEGDPAITKGQQVSQQPPKTHTWTKTQTKTKSFLSESWGGGGPPATTTVVTTETVTHTVIITHTPGSSLPATVTALLDVSDLQTASLTLD